MLNILEDLSQVNHCLSVTCSDSGEEHFRRRRRMKAVNHSKWVGWSSKWQRSHDDSCRAFEMTKYRDWPRSLRLVFPPVSHTFRGKDFIVFGLLVPTYFHSHLRYSVKSNNTDVRNQTTWAKWKRSIF